MKFVVGFSIDNLSLRGLIASVAQWQSRAFVKLRSQVQILSEASPPGDR